MALETINNYINYLTNYRADSQFNNFDLTINEIIEFINNTFELKTGCKLYNKKEIIHELQESTDLLITTTSLILKNYIPQITFDDFKNKFEFSLLFNNDNIIVFYKNIKIIDHDNIKDIVFSEKKDYLPEYYNLYFNNIFNVISKFINKDISVKYNCLNIPLPYLNLFIIKCNKTNNINDNSIVYLSIINGHYYKEPEQKNIINDNNDDNTHRFEVMSYLDDINLSLFLDITKLIDEKHKDILNMVKSELVKYIDFLLSSLHSTNNKIFKIYIVNQIFKTLLINTTIIYSHNEFRKVVYNKINEISTDVKNIVSYNSELKLIDDIYINMEKCKQIIDNINST